jgi:hypothetical protein
MPTNSVFIGQHLKETRMRDGHEVLMDQLIWQRAPKCPLFDEIRSGSQTIEIDQAHCMAIRQNDNSQRIHSQ